MSNQALQESAIKYAHLCGISLNLKTPLGYGNDGVVWKSSRQTAVKAFEQQFKYDRESACYQRLAEHNVKSIHGLAVPQLTRISHHAEGWRVVLAARGRYGRDGAAVGG